MKNNKKLSLESQLKTIINEQTSKVLEGHSSESDESYTKGYKDATFDLTGKIDKLLSSDSEGLTELSSLSEDARSSNNNNNNNNNNSGMLDALSLINQIELGNNLSKDNTDSSPSPLDSLGVSTTSLYLIHINLYDKTGHLETVSQYADSNSYDDIQYFSNNLLDYIEGSDTIADQITGTTLISLKDIVKIKLILDPHKYTVKKNGRLDLSTKDDQESLLLYRDEETIKELLKC